MRPPLLDLAARPPRRRPAAVLNVAHRGASDVAPENTLAAITGAVVAGTDMMEVDVQRSKDGVPVLIHDTTLVRTTNARAVFPRRAPWRVDDFTYEELMELDAGSWKSPEFADERLPTLAAAMQPVWAGGLGLLLEVKAPDLYPGIVPDLVATARSVPGFADAVAEGKLVVQSFDFVAMKEHKTLAPSVPVGLLGAPAITNLPALATWADQVNPNYRYVNRRYVDRVRTAGMGCQVWTVNRRSAMKRAVRMGVDGVITNRPDALAGVVTQPRSSRVCLARCHYFGGCASTVQYAVRGDRSEGPLRSPRRRARLA